jgi:hypothetical protein
MKYLKSACGIDLAYDVSDLVFAEDDDGNRAIFVAFENTTEDELEDCMAKIYAFLGHELGVGRDGKLTVYTLGEERFTAAWLAPRVLAFDPEWTDGVAKMIAGPGTTQPARLDGVGWFVDDQGSHKIEARDVLGLAQQLL